MQRIANLRYGLTSVAPLQADCRNTDVALGFEPAENFASCLFVARLHAWVRSRCDVGLHRDEVLLQQQCGGQPLLELQLRRGD